jgi:hypothetical protein
MTVALAYAKRGKIDYAIEKLIRGGNALQEIAPGGTLSMVSCLCWMYLWKCRESPRLAPEGVPMSEAKTKEYYIYFAGCRYLTCTSASALVAYAPRSPSHPVLCQILALSFCKQAFSLCS